MKLSADDVRVLRKFERGLGKMISAGRQVVDCDRVVEEL